MDATTFRSAAKSVIDEIVDYAENVETRRVVPEVKPEYLRRLLPKAAPTSPQSFGEIRADIQSKIMPGITQWGSPRFMAFFPCGSSYPAAIAEMYSNAFTGANFKWVCSPAATELEVIVLDWLVKALGLPECFLSTSSTRGGGVIHGSATESIVLAMTAARRKYLNARTKYLPEEEKDEEKWRLASKLVALGSSQVHSSTEKAARIAGVRFATVPTTLEKDYAMCGDTLEAVV